jgi:acetyl-CoA acetyltransferase family protein
MATEVFICDAVRTPIGRYADSLSSVRPDDLAAIPLVELLRRNPGLDPTRIDDVVFGCVNQAGEDNRNVARMALLLAGYPVDVPAVTLNRLCGSGMDAVGTAARAIRAGEIELAIAGGVESMSRAPFVMPKAESAFARAPAVYDTTIGWRMTNPKLEAMHGADPMADTAENLAQQYQVSREAQDAMAWRSQQRAAAAQESGFFAEEIVPVTIRSKRGETVLVDRDEHPRATTMEALAKLKPITRPDGTVTAGNASGVNDAAAAIILASERAVNRHGLTPASCWRGRVLASMQSM